MTMKQRRSEAPEPQSREEVRAQRRELMDQKMAERAENERRRLAARQTIGERARPSRRMGDVEDDDLMDQDRNDYKPVKSSTLRIPENWRTLGSPAVKSLAVNLTGKPVKTREQAEDIVHKEVERRRRSGKNLVTGRVHNKDDVMEADQDNLAGDGLPMANEGMRAYRIPPRQAKRGEGNPTANEGLQSWEVDLEKDSEGDGAPTRNEGVESWEKDEDEERDVSGEGDPANPEDDESNVKGNIPRGAKHGKSADVAGSKAAKAKLKKMRRKKLRERRAKQGKGRPRKNRDED